MRDESTADVRIVLEIKKDADPELVMAYLYKHTPLQTNFNVNLTCLVPDREPGGRRARSGSTSRRCSSTSSTSASRWSPGGSSSSSPQLKKRLHILEGFEKVFDALDEMIRIIRKSDGKAGRRGEADEALRARREQVDAILELKLYKLAQLEILVIQKELEEKRAEASAARGAAQGREASAGRVVQDELGR